MSAGEKWSAPRKLVQSDTQLRGVDHRPNASGFAGLVHLKPVEGPQYQDVLDYLDPAAARRLGFEYVHAVCSNSSSATAPRASTACCGRSRASTRRPAPGSYEALRRAVPASATVFVPDIFEPRRPLRVARALSHARLLGAIVPAALHLLTPRQIEPLGGNVPDLVIMSAKFIPRLFPPASRQPIWWNDDTAVYALNGTVDPIMPLTCPPKPESHVC